MKTPVISVRKNRLSKLAAVIPPKLSFVNRSPSYHSNFSTWVVTFLKLGHVRANVFEFDL